MLPMASFSLHGVFVLFLLSALLCKHACIAYTNPNKHTNKTKQNANTQIAGFMAALWILRDSKARHKTLALYCMVRMLGDWMRLIQHYRKDTKKFSLETLFTSKTDVKVSKLTPIHSPMRTPSKSPQHKKKQQQEQQQNMARELSYSNLDFSISLETRVKSLLNSLKDDLQSGDVILFTLAQIFIMYGTMHAPKALDATYYKWIKNMGQMKESQIVYTMRSRIDASKMYRLPQEKWMPCNPIWHENKSCLWNNCVDFLKCILRAGRMYLPVHFLPMLLFTPKIVFANPLTFLKLKSLNTLRSALFLSIYVFNMKQSVCMLRNYFKSDGKWISFAGGFMAGLSILAEHTKRRSELALYVIPRAIEIVFRLIPKESSSMFALYPMLYKLLRLRFLPVISFAMAMSGWMTLIAVKNGTKYANGLNMTVLRVVFGSLH